MHEEAGPQMVAGHMVENDDKLWRLTLRPGLTFHDGSPVLARDCVASIARWGKRDAMGQTLMAYTDELTAPDDRTIQFRLKKPFALLPDALGKVGSSICAMTEPSGISTGLCSSIIAPFVRNTRYTTDGAVAIRSRSNSRLSRS